MCVQLGYSVVVSARFLCLIAAEKIFHNSSPKSMPTGGQIIRATANSWRVCGGGEKYELRKAMGTPHRRTPRTTNLAFRG